MNRGDRTHLLCKYAQQKNPSDLIQKLSSLLSNPITKKDYDRQSELISDYLELSANGALLGDLIYIMDVIEGYAFNIVEDENNISTELLNKLLSICFQPPNLTKASDAIIYAKDLEAFFSLLGYQLLCLENESTQLILVGALTRLLKDVGAEEIRCISLEKRQDAFENSYLPSIFAQLLHSCSETIYPHILKAILICRRTDKFLKAIVKQDALNSLLTRLEVTWRGRYSDKPPDFSVSHNIVVPHYDEISSLVWILLKYLQNNPQMLSSIENIEIFSLWNLKYVLRIFVNSDKQQCNRNDILAIIITLIELFPNLGLIKSGLATDILEHSLQAKIWPHCSNKEITEIDFTFIKLVLVAISLYVKFEGGGQVLETGKVMPQLLNIIKHHNNAAWAKWPMAYLCQITNLTWYVLRKIVPHVEDDFIEHSGLLIILNCFKMQNTSQHNLPILDKCLSTLVYLLKHDNKKSFLNSMIYNDGLCVILDLLDIFLKTESLSTQTQACIKQSFSLLTRLCGGVNPPFQVVDLVLNYLDRFLKPKPNEPVYDNGIIVYTMDFIWETIVASPELSRAAFKGGIVYKMLDIAQKYPFHVKIITLGVLVDLCEDDTSVPYLITWKGKQGVNVISLLMEIFRHENKMLRVKTGPTGKISDFIHPIMGEEQRKHTYECKYAKLSSPAIFDMHLSCRPKVYALLQLLFERHKRKVAIANEYYKTCNEQLPGVDQVTLLLAENFLPLKLSEAWKELQIEFEALSFSPTPTDAKIISCLGKRSEKWGKYIMKLQQSILKEDKASAIKEESSLYEKLCDARIQDALEAVCELKYLARATERMFRISQKYIHHHQIDTNLGEITCNISQLHRTYQYMPTVTAVFNQQVSVLSNIIDVEREKEPSLISMEDSDIGLEMSEGLCTIESHQEIIE